MKATDKINTLEKLGVLEKVREYNQANTCVHIGSIDELLNDEELDTAQVISSAFLFCETPEGHDHWMQVVRNAAKEDCAKISIPEPPKTPKPEAGPTTGQKVNAQLWGFFTGYFSEKVERIQATIFLTLLVIFVLIQIARAILQNYGIAW